MTTVSGNLLTTNTDAAWPFLDSFTTWASVVTTFMVARKILENWIYWIVIDALSILLYAARGLYLYRSAVRRLRGYRCVRLPELAEEPCRASSRMNSRLAPGATEDVQHRTAQ